MQTLTKGYRGLSLLVDLNLDRLLMIVTMLAALTLGGMIGAML